MRGIIRKSVFSSIALGLLIGVAGAQEVAVPLTLEESIAIALRQSVVIQSAREGGRPRRRRGRRKPSRGFSRN